MVNFGTCLPKARTIGSVMEWSPPRQTGRKPPSRNSPTLCSMAAKGSSKVNFKSPASQYAPSALRSRPVSVHEFEESDRKATRMMGVPGLGALGGCAIEHLLVRWGFGVGIGHENSIIRYSIEDLIMPAST